MLIGNLCNDVEIRNTTDGKKVSTLNLAVTRPFKSNTSDQYETDFIEVSVWDSLCDVASTYLRKGSKIAVKGRLASHKITLESGAVVNKLELIGERVVFLSSPETV